jgi:hypothetical protein
MLPAGCGLALWIYLGACLALLVATSHRFFLVLSVPALLIAGFVAVPYVYGLGLLLAVRFTWSRRGVRCLMVHSNSPAWEAHIRTVWLPRFGHLAVTLNWTERAGWRPTLAVRVFKRFCRAQHNFNPAVVVFRGLRRPRVFRFFYAFREVEAGRPEYLQRLEADLFAALEVGERRR